MNLFLYVEEEAFMTHQIEFSDALEQENDVSLRNLFYADDGSLKESLY